MKKAGFYELILNNEEQINDNYRITNLEEHSKKIKNVDDYLLLCLKNEYLLKKIQALSDITSKLNFINQIVQNNIDNKEKFQNQILLSINDIKENNLSVSCSLIENKFFTNASQQELLTEINQQILTSDEVWLIYPFISKSITNKIFDNLVKISNQGKKIKLITTTFDKKGTNFNFHDLEYLLTNIKNIEIKVENTLEIWKQRIHIKGIIFLRHSGFGTLIMGSSNFTSQGLILGREWNLMITEYHDKNIYYEILEHYQKIWNDELINFNNENERKKLQEQLQEIINNSFEESNKKILLYSFQKDILNHLEILRKEKNTKNLLVMATGTGKTVISAYDYLRYSKLYGTMPSLLFIAHQKEILQQAQKTFIKVLNNKTFGNLFCSGELINFKETNFLFATIQSIYNNLTKFNPKQFHYIIFDEAHHLAAKSFDQVIKYFYPQQLVGLTATPEREDGKTILTYFDNTIAYELRIWDAINNNVLCPFDYYCVDDFTSNLQDADISSDQEVFKKLNLPSQCQILYETIEKYLGIYAKPLCLIFCTTIKHAEIINNFLLEKKLKSAVFTSQNKNRFKILSAFQNRLINYLCVVNIFNEGIDVPDVDTIIFLRPTSSKTVFLQQLGRGLRKSKNKIKLEVYDLINNINNKFDITLAIRNLVNPNFSLKHALNNNFNLPNNCTITLEKRSRELIIHNIHTWYTNRNRINNLVQQYYEQYQENGLAKLLQDYNLQIGDFYNQLNNFYLKIGKKIINYQVHMNDSKRNTNILKQFLFLNNYNLINYIIKRLEKQIHKTELNDEYDNFFIVSFFYEVTSNAKYQETIGWEQTNIIDFIIKNNYLIVQELIILLKCKIANELNLIINNKQTLLLKNSIYTVRQALCALKRIQFIGSRNELKIIAFQAGYLTHKDWQIILADVDGKNYGKLTNYNSEQKEFYWSVPETMTIKNKLVVDLQSKKLTHYIFFNNKINDSLENLKIKLYNFIGLGFFEELLIEPSITVKYKIKE